MARVTTVRVDGLRELGEAMRKLSKGVALKTARAATAAGARVIKKAAVTNIEKSPSIETGSLHDSVIVKRLGKGESGLTSEHIVTVRGRGKVIKRGKNKGQRQASAPHAHLVEFGTVNMPAEPFLRPAYDTNKMQAVDAIKDKLAQRIAKVKS